MNRPQLDAQLMEGFVTGLLLADFDDPQPTPPFHRVAWNMVTSEHPRVALAAPRSHAKSTGITFAYALATLLFRAQDFVVIVSSTHSKAIEFVRNIKDTLLKNEHVQQVFQFNKLVKDAEDDFIVSIGRDNHEFRVIALGFGMSVRGLNWGTRRPGLIVCHAPGTWVEDGDFAGMVERHPTAKFYEAERLRITLRSVEEDEIVSVDHRYLVKRNSDAAPEWVMAKELRPGFLIGDWDEQTEAVDDPGAGRARPSEQGAVCCEQPRESATREDRVSRETSRADHRVESQVSGDTPRGRSGSKTGLLRQESRSVRCTVACVLEGAFRAKERVHATATSVSGSGDSSVGRYEVDSRDLRQSPVAGDVGGPHHSVETPAGLRPTRRSQPTTYSTAGELEEAASLQPERFSWRPITNVASTIKGFVVAIRTKSGFYKTKFGMSHNCDDM